MGVPGSLNSVPKKRERTQESFFDVLERDGMFRYIFSVIFRPVTVGFEVPKNGMVLRDPYCRYI